MSSELHMPVSLRLHLFLSRRVLAQTISFPHAPALLAIDHKKAATEFMHKWATVIVLGAARSIRVVVSVAKVP